MYDSFFNTYHSLKFSTRPICQILQPNPGSIVNIKLVSTQHQCNASDCDVFVCAFMDSLLRGRRPVGVVYDIPRMRQRLAVCLERSTLTAFPFQCQEIRRPQDVCLRGPSTHCLRVSQTLTKQSKAEMHVIL